MVIVLRNILVFLMCVSLVACTTNKSQLGLIVGGTIGGVAGAALGKEKNRELGIAIGATLGSFIGYYLGKTLDRRDQEALEQETEKAIKYAKINKPIVWQSDHSKANAEITVIKEKIVPVYLYDKAKKAISIKKMQIRSGPGFAFDIMQILPAHKHVFILGFAENGWYKIKTQNIEGFVTKGCLKEIERRVQKRVVKNNYKKLHRRKEALKQTPVKTLYEPKVQDYERKEEISRIVKTKCKTVRVKVKDNNGNISVKQFETCQDEHGSWGA